jgi:hypothetical protein
MNIRRLMLDVDKAMARPSIVELAEAIDSVSGVEALNITVLEIDVETVGMNVIIEGNDLDYTTIVEAIEKAGAVVHSIDEIAAGTRILPFAGRQR